MSEFDHTHIEKKMQKYWNDIDAFKADDNSKKPKSYILDMFPYPSGAGLHIGHIEGYAATDVVARYRRMKGEEVLHPIGWDAFGLPAENYAIKVNKHPRIVTDENIKTFRKQCKMVGLSFDWDREIDTSSEDYYQWTQWFFLFLYNNQLAYRKDSLVNWCEHDQTVLANEQVVDGKCERCDNEVVKKKLAQWFFKVTDYAERLLNDLDPLDWPEPLKEMQRNWIGRSEGAKLAFAVKDSKEVINVFTTRADTLYGATYMVLAPEHELVSSLTTDAQKKEVTKYCKVAAKKSDLDRQTGEKEKAGVFTGSYAINPVNGEEIPVWVADYVLMGYGTGAIMAVPAHDERDHAFATKYDLKIARVISGGEEELPYLGEGKTVNSGEHDGLSIEEAKKKITKKAKGKMAITYKIRDWLISRQRFWGAPIPIVYCDDCGIVPVPEDQLPVKLPKVADFKTVGDGKSPLARVEDFVNTECPKCDKPAKRETDTMDGFVDNSWYFFRYLDPRNENVFADKKKMAAWMPVDLYVGGAEHAVGHLIYARFFTKALHDHGYVKFEEPFKKLVNQGLILAEDGRKMSKRWGNVISPEDVIKEYGADTLRMYLLFLGPLWESKPWDSKGIVGVRRFLDKVMRFYKNGGVRSDVAADDELTAELHKTVDKVTKDIEKLHFNTAISAMMSFVNLLADKGLPKVEGEVLLKLLFPFAPHTAEYLWQEMGNTDHLGFESWPVADERLLKEEMTILAVQINGKVRDKIEIATDADEAAAKAAALASEKVVKHLAGAKIKKVIYVQGRIISFLTD